MSDAVKEYGRALAELAAEENIGEQLLAETRAVRAILEEHPAYVRMLANPEIAKAERTAMLDEAFSGRVHRHLLSFLKLITERGCARQAAQFLAEYDRLCCERYGIVTASVQSAVPLSGDQRRRLTEKLSALTGKRIELSCRVDPTLIGGIRVIANNTLLEDSVRAKLDGVRTSLAALTI